MKAATKKATKTKATRKPSAKPTDKASTTPATATLGKAQTAVLKLLAKGRPLTRQEIGKATGIQTGFTSLLGHTEPARREPQSLAARGFITIEQRDVDGRSVVVNSITAAGRKALAE
jgi:DNA-binding PadR family transcriptional regulator